MGQLFSAHSTTEHHSWLINDTWPPLSFHWVGLLNGNTVSQASDTFFPVFSFSFWFKLNVIYSDLEIILMCGY